MNVIVYGPQGCGKSKNADRLAAYFGCKKIVELDDYRELGQSDARRPLYTETRESLEKVDTLFLTNSDLLLDDLQLIGDARVIGFGNAMNMLNLPVQIPEFLRRGGSFGGGE